MTSNTLVVTFPIRYHRKLRIWGNIRGQSPRVKTLWDIWGTVPTDIRGLL